MNHTQAQPALRKKLRPHVRLYLAGAGILIAGLIAAVAIYSTATDAGDDNADTSVYALIASNRYHHDLENIGGKSAVLAAGLDDWFSGLWHGKQLGVTVACLATISALVCFLFAYLLSFQPPADEPGNDDAQ